MGKNKYIVLSGFNLSDNNRGTAALGYGTLYFCIERGLFQEGDEFLVFKYGGKLPHSIWTTKDVVINGKYYTINEVYISRLESKLLIKYGILLPFTNLQKVIHKTKHVVAINGGDGFSDIYGDLIFQNRLVETYFAMQKGLSLIILPQTLGPFDKDYNYKIAEKILRYASLVYVRDEKFVEDLNRMGIHYEITKDLSAYMLPEPWNIDIKPNSVGINVSGLCYSNSFKTLSGRFNHYPLLIDSIIRHFTTEGKTVYLIPHSYNYSTPEDNNDDLVACRQVYERIENKKNVIVASFDMTSPQVKYLISKMSFFIGTRMHANFAAIYTGTPLFGLAYSYKFVGAFNSNGLNGESQTCNVLDLKENDIDKVVQKIVDFYKITRQ